MKFTAALQAATNCAKPIVLKADTLDGYLGDPAATRRSDASLDYLTFISRELGVLTPR